MIACLHNHDNIALFLLENGANSELESSDGRTAYTIAEKYSPAVFKKMEERRNSNSSKRRFSSSNLSKNILTRQSRSFSNYPLESSTKTKIIDSTTIPTNNEKIEISLPPLPPLPTPPVIEKLDININLSTPSDVLNHCTNIVSLLDGYDGNNNFIALNDKLLKPEISSPSSDLTKTSNENNLSQSTESTSNYSTGVPKINLASEEKSSNTSTNTHVSTPRPGNSYAKNNIIRRSTLSLPSQYKAELLITKLSKLFYLNSQKLEYFEDDDGDDSLTSDDVLSPKFGFTLNSPKSNALDLSSKIGSNIGPTIIENTHLDENDTVYNVRISFFRYIMSFVNNYVQYSFENGEKSKTQVIKTKFKTSIQFLKELLQSIEAIEPKDKVNYDYIIEAHKNTSGDLQSVIENRIAAEFANFESSIVPKFLLVAGSNHWLCLKTYFYDSITLNMYINSMLLLVKSGLESKFNPNEMVNPLINIILNLDYYVAIMKNNLLSKMFEEKVFLAFSSFIFLRIHIIGDDQSKIKYYSALIEESLLWIIQNAFSYELNKVGDPFPQQDLLRMLEDSSSMLDKLKKNNPFERSTETGINILSELSEACISLSLHMKNYIMYDKLDILNIITVINNVSATFSDNNDIWFYNSSFGTFRNCIHIFSHMLTSLSCILTENSNCDLYHFVWSIKSAAMCIYLCYSLFIPVSSK